MSNFCPLVQGHCAIGTEITADDIMGLDNSEILDALEDSAKLNELIANESSKSHGIAMTI